MKKGVGVIIENNNGDILVVEEKETREYYSKFKGDISVPFGTVGDNYENEGSVDALYREVLEETGLNLEENRHLPCEFGSMYFCDTKGIVLFDVKLFHIKLNGVLKKYEEKILNNEIKNSYFISKNDFEIKIKEGGIRAGADVFYENFEKVLEVENSITLPKYLKKIILEDNFYRKNIVVVGDSSKYNLKKLKENE